MRTLVLTLVLGVASLLLGTTRPYAATRPNVLLILSDDLGWPYYGFMIDELARTLPDWDPQPSIACGPQPPAGDDCQMYVCTPNLDRLAREGIAFGSGYVSAPHCTHSHESIFTGLNRRDLAAFPGIGCTGNGDPEDGRPQTIPEALGSPDADTVEEDTRLGYNTVLKGKWWLGNTANFFNDRTYDGNPADPDLRSENDKTIGETKTLKSLKKWVKAQHTDTPWFAVWSPEMPHYSYSGIAQHAPSLDGFYDHMETRNPPLITGTNYSTQATREYFESISYFDARVGEVIQFLDQLECGTNPDPETDAPVPNYTGHWPGNCPEALPYETTCSNPARYAGFRTNTLILYVTDNGAGLQFSKANFRENGLRSPIIAYYPNAIPSSDAGDGNATGYTPHPAAIGAIDFFPTILEYAGEAGYAESGGVPLQRRFPDARSFRALAENPDAYEESEWRAQGRRYFFSNSSNGSTAMRAVRDSCPAAYTEQAGDPEAQVPSPSAFKLYNNNQNYDLQTFTPKPKRLANLDHDPFEILYKPVDFLLSEVDPGEAEPRYADGTAVEPALNTALISWWGCPYRADDESSQAVRRSLALDACEGVPVRCPDDAPCPSTVPAPAPCEAYVDPDTTCPEAAP